MPVMNDPSPEAQLFHLVSGYWHTQAIYVAAKLRIADLLKDGPRTVDDLATATGTHRQSLYRLLRALSSIGIFSQNDNEQFSLTSLAQPLRSDVPGSQQAMAIMRGEWQYHAWGELLYSIQTGNCAFEKVYGAPLFDYLLQNPKRNELFDDAMTSIHGREASAMLESYDFSGTEKLIDVGGGNGSLLASVLQKFPDMKGILFDRPAVVDRSNEHVRDAGLNHRCQLVAGDFFTSVPSDADTYLLRHIIHDWNDDQSVTILRNCRRAMSNTDRLLVIESVIPTDNEPFFGKWFDLAMMVVPGGMERTEEEYGMLFEAAGFRMNVIRTTMEISVIEGSPV